MTLKLTKEQFLDKCKTFHGNKFNYGLVDYVNNLTKVKIICSEHGVFEQTPTNHFKGQGCPSCGGTKKLNTVDFVKKAKLVHGDRYDYSESNYVTAHINVKIRCYEHGIFTQTPANHFSGKGCPSCVGVKRLDKESFIEKAKQIHGDTYDYSKVLYKGNKIKIIIVCNKHGEFKQTPDSHMRGVSCPGCAEYGFDRTRSASLYVLRSCCGHYMKIGITHNPKQRYNKLKHGTPFSFKRIEIIEGPGEQIADLEKELLSCYQPAEFDNHFDGYTEWRLWNDSIRHKLISFMDKELTHGLV